MALVLSIFGIAFAASCVWLTVRIVNRREKWATWTLAFTVTGLPTLYVLSFGPACYFLRQELIPQWAWSTAPDREERMRCRESIPAWTVDPLKQFYSPLCWAAYGARHPIIYVPLRWEVELWTPI